VFGRIPEIISKVIEAVPFHASDAVTVMVAAAYEGGVPINLLVLASKVSHDGNPVAV
jgi:hypothetical protein